jgi:D-inositol-3-phosphate glycosyltransferase
MAVSEAEKRVESAPPERRARIVLVGPDPEARGGIAQFGSHLASTLAPVADVVAIGFRRLYPAYTRPGRVPAGYSSADSVLVPWRPWTWIEAGRRLKHAQPDLVVFQWWLPLLGPAYRYLARRAHRSGARVLVVCHNACPHERFPFARLLTRAALRRADLIVTLSEHVGSQVRELLPEADVEVLGHPTFALGEDPEAPELWHARIGAVERPIILFFGYVRPYKGLVDLLEAFPFVRRSVPATLVVAGTFYERLDRFEQQAQRLDVHQHVRFFPAYVPDGEVTALFELADVIALPYRSASQSGIVAQASAAGLPVVTTSVGGLTETLPTDAVVVPPRTPAALAEGILRAFDRPRPAREPVSGWADWGALVEAQARIPPAPPARNGWLGRGDATTETHAASSVPRSSA